MIVSTILGGIGNQMFQYAAGRALALSRNEPLLVNLAGFDRYPLHQGYELQRVFELETEAAHPNLIRDILGWRTCSLAQKVLKRPAFAWLRGKHLAIEPHFHYWPGLSSTTSPVYMIGYWQSARYFEHCNAQIREDFRFRHPLRDMSADLAAKIAACQSVSLHVRRGDYISHKPTSKIMHVCTLGYYREAVRWISDRIIDPFYFVFTDDLNWVRREINFLPRFAVVDNSRGQNSYRDMQLMSACRHHIIANSSFSWWGAWLNTNPEKIVIAPRDWFRNGIDDADLVPPQWIRL